ncbi:MAG: hypothetical protein JJU20_03905 [Opitutales bacterium]|nr:hypothetical protein [Opitutales bacterium]
MTSKERVLTTFALEKADRVPVNYLANPGIDRRLKQHFGLVQDDHEGLFEALGVDFREVPVPYKGPKLHADRPEQGIVVDHWGNHRRWIEHSTGGYWDYCEFPLREAEEEAVAAWPMPDPDDFDYSGIKAQCQRWKHCAVALGNPGLADVINSNGMLRGMEQTLIDLFTEEPAGLLLAKRRLGIQLEMARRALEAADGGIDLLWLGEDLGTQVAPLISLDLYRSVIRPLHQPFIDLAKSFNIPVMVHSCGSSSWVYEDFIEMGVTAVDTLQPEANNMSPEYLKSKFGGRLAFHGCISTAGPVAYGSVEETIAICKKTLEIMMPVGGYCFAPTHLLQDNSPTENVLAMYETAHKFGRYR